MPSVFDEWSPVTHDMGLIQAPLADIRAAFMDWHAGLGQPQAESQLTNGFTDALEHLAPLSAGHKRRLFVGTQSGWTAQFQSGTQGSDPFPAMCFLAQQLGVLAMRVCATAPDVTYPATIWEVYAPPELGGTALSYRRAISSMNDGGPWVFGQSGTPFPFERLDQYGARRKRDRFSKELLREYLQQFELRPFEDDFYVVDAAQPAVLLQRPPWKDEPPEFSLAEVKAGVPWKR